MNYARTVVGYHGCDVKVARALLRGLPFQPSENDYDWLGRGTYFWEYGADRAYKFAGVQIERGRVRTPASVGALIQLGNCFDLLDTRFTSDLSDAFRRFEASMRKKGAPMPRNEGSGRMLRRLDCAVLNWYLGELEQDGQRYDTVRGAFTEGDPIFEGSGIHRETHIQLAVRNPACVLGVFKPTLWK